ncbi:MAG: argininosuccinate lyase [Thermoleophilia bacterium]|nr:argininosuccinate lyase [Thermoleophilia bacterium]
MTTPPPREPGYLGEGGRLTGGPAPELVASGYAQEISHGPRLAAAMSWADTAHAVALAEGGGIDAPTAAALLGGLAELDAIPDDRFPWDAARGDAFNSREAELTRRVGKAAAGWLSAGRPRRESFRVAVRLVARAQAVELHDALVESAAAFVALAGRHRDALAADYTYLQPAQPTTAGHLMLAYAYPALRDAARIRGVHAELARSVAGAGGSAGSRWPLDRVRLAELLGCDGIVLHAKDAAWQADVYVDLLGAVATAFAHASQMAQDFEIFASREFGIVELADAHSRASALMPQKRNPYALAVIRAMAGTAAGELSGLLVALHTGTARTDHFHVVNGAVPRVMDEAVAVARLAARVVEGMRVDVDRMATVAREGFVVAADLADVVAMRCGVDYRTAHHIVGRAVREATDAGRSPDALGPADIAAAAAAVGVEGLDVPADIAEVLDPATCARERLQPGSSSPEAMAQMLEDCAARIGRARAWAEAARAREAAGLRARDDAVRRLRATGG